MYTDIDSALVGFLSLSPQGLIDHEPETVAEQLAQTILLEGIGGGNPRLQQLIVDRAIGRATPKERLAEENAILAAVRELGRE